MPAVRGILGVLGMFRKQGATFREAQSKIEAIDRSQAVIEFALDGTILTANENFLAAMGYALEEIVGKHHSMFVPSDYASSDEYRAFWKSLAQGLYQADEFKRLAKGGREIWIQASYNPVLDRAGKPVKVIKFATDITAQKLPITRLRLPPSGGYRRSSSSLSMARSSPPMRTSFQRSAMASKRSPASTMQCSAIRHTPHHVTMPISGNACALESSWPVSSSG